MDNTTSKPSKIGLLQKILPPVVVIDSVPSVCMSVCLSLTLRTVKVRACSMGVFRSNSVTVKFVINDRK